MKVKAKIVSTEPHTVGSLHAIIYVGSAWRVLGTPYKVGKGEVKPYAMKKAAIRGAETTAKALGITLEWEG